MYCGGSFHVRLRKNFTTKNLEEKGEYEVVWKKQLSLQVKEVKHHMIRNEAYNSPRCDDWFLQGVLRGPKQQANAKGSS